MQYKLPNYYYYYKILVIIIMIFRRRVCGITYDYFILLHNQLNYVVEL